MHTIKFSPYRIEKYSNINLLNNKRKIYIPKINKQINNDINNNKDLLLNNAS